MSPECGGSLEQRKVFADGDLQGTRHELHAQRTAAGADRR